MPSYEQGVPLQTDTLSNVPGGAIRTITVTTLVNGVQTPVQMQVVCLADPNGVLLEAREILLPVLVDISEILKDIRVMMSKLSDMPFTDDEFNHVKTAGVIP